MNAKEYLAYQSRVRHFLQSNDVMPGCHGAKYIDRGEGGEVVEPFFSWSSCECCGSSLGGNRETYVFSRNPGHLANEEPMFEADICTDCVCFLEYGRLDDQTMMEIEASPA